METALEQLKQHLQQPGTPPPSRAELEALCTRYPWFAAPYAVLCSAYADQLSDSELLTLRQRHAVLTAGCAVGADDAADKMAVSAAPVQPAAAADQVQRAEGPVSDQVEPGPSARPHAGGRVEPGPSARPYAGDRVETGPSARPQTAVPPPFTGLGADGGTAAVPPPFTGFDIDDDQAATEGSATEPSATEPSATEPSVTEPPVLAGSATEPSATEQVLSTYFATFGHTTAEEDALLERMIFNPQPDYASVLMQQEADEAAAPAGGSHAASVAGGAHAAAAPAGGSHAAVQAEGGSAAGSPSPVPTGPSARQTGAATPQVQAPTLPGAAEVSDVAQALKPQRTADRPKQAADSSLLSESLAKIFIKQGRYDRAYEIISNLNLNYPEKSVYFADQLRFLRKLMHLQAAAQQANESHGE